MKPRHEPEIVDLSRRRAEASKKTKPRREMNLGPWASWGVLLSAAVIWALVRWLGA